MPRGLTQLEFLEKAEAKHGDKYDLSKVEYTKANQKIIIGCEIHSFQELVANDFLKGRGCPSCGRSDRHIGRMDFAQKKFQKHMEKFEDKIIAEMKTFVSMSEKMTFVCTTHGVFKSTPSHYMMTKYGCEACSKIYRIEEQREETLKRLTEVLEPRYPHLSIDWSSFEGYELPIRYECDIHGPGTTLPSILELKETKYGCKTCGYEKNGIAKTMLAKENFEVNARELHAEVYVYKMETYFNSQTAMQIICSEHGIFEQTPAEHLQGKGCAKCGSIRGGLKKRSGAAKVFIQKAKEIHGDKYDYSLVDYIDAKNKVLIICKKCSKKQGEEKAFWQTPNKHLSMQGCPDCAEYGFDNSKSANLYFFKIKDQNIYKVGITNRTMKKRYQKQESEMIEPILEVTFANGEEAEMMEKRIIAKYSDYKYNGPDVLRTAKTTEMFTKNIAEGIEKMMYHSVLLEE